MKFSAQEEYGLRLLVQIGKACDRTMTIPELARHEELSEPHVAKLLMILRKAGFIKSARGSTGGYMLASKADEIRIGDVLAALGGKLHDDGFCSRHSGLAAECCHLGDCALDDLWAEVQGAVDGVLSGKVLSDLFERRPALIQVQIGAGNANA